MIGKDKLVTLAPTFIDKVLGRSAFSLLLLLLPLRHATILISFPLVGTLSLSQFVRCRDRIGIGRTPPPPLVRLSIH